MITKDEAKKEIQDLVEDFQSNKSYYLKTDEANIETKLVEPLFKALGWTKQDFEKREKVQREHKRGIPDYAFKVDNRIVFFLEVKAASVNIDKDKSTWKQAISYALSKRIPFAVLTDFEGIKIFCVEQENALNNQFRDIKYTEYITRFEDLWLLSKESFEKNYALEMAVREQRLKKRKTIDSQLLEDLMRIRKLIADSIEKNHPQKYTPNEKDDIIQRILDRLIFIRKAEDVGINRPNIVLKELVGFHEDKTYSELKKIFTIYNEDYNSGLFAKDTDNDCDSIRLDGKIVKELISLLYESKNGDYIYDFEWIDADVLGQVYEQYLGIILQQTKKGVSKLKEGQSHRKEQGIYYTPTYIVDYIVKNTVGEILKDEKAKHDTIRILDPACGSGSFLIKAFDLMNEFHSKHSKNYAQKTFDTKSGTTFSIKERILKNNIFGVDLDNKAVEIAQLNLLLKIAEKGHKLPLLQQNIKCGNSLIDDENLAGIKAFKWEKEFEEIEKDGWFDVVIGNPPYINAIQLTKTVGENTKNYWKKKFKSAKGTYDIYILFFEQALNVCKEGGFVSFITPNKYLSSPYGAALRELITKNYKLVKVLDLSKVKVFDDPSVYPIITIIQKTKPKKEYTIKTEKMFSENIEDKVTYNVSSKKLETLPDYIWGIILSDNVKIIEKIFSKCESLEDVATVQATSTAAESDEYSNYIKEDAQGTPIINTGTIDRYSTKYGITKLMNKGKKLDRPVLDLSKVSEKRKKLYKTPKIILAKLALRLEGFLDIDKQYASINTNCIHTPKSGYSIEYLSGVINSKLISFVYSELFSGLRMSGGYFQFQAPQIRILPIVKPSKEQQSHMSELVKRMLILNKKLDDIGNKKTSETQKLLEEIKRTDKEIDELVYKIYGITEEEKKIIEESIK